MVVAEQHAVLIASCSILRLITRSRIHVGVLCVLLLAEQDGASVAVAYQGTPMQFASTCLCRS